MTAPLGPAELRIPRGTDEPSGKPRRVLIFSDGDAECGCRRDPRDRRRSRHYTRAEAGCAHVEAARRWLVEPCRVVVDELLDDWYRVGWHPDDRLEWAAHATRRLQEAREADEARKAAEAGRAEIEAAHADRSAWHRRSIETFA